MHERSLASALLHQVEALMRANSAHCVVAVHVSIGEFSGVEPELLVSAFDELADSTLAAGADLSIRRVPLECRCLDCGWESNIERFRFECGKCGGRRLEILRGEELTLESVTLEGDEP